MIPAAVVREMLEYGLGFSVPEEAWNFLVDERYVASVENGDEDVNWLADKCRRLLIARGDPVPTEGNAPQMRGGRASTGSPTDQMRSADWKLTARRMDAIAALFAREAASDPEVVAFRAEILNGRLLDMHEVEEWIRQQANVEGPPTRWMDMPIPPAYEIKETESGFLMLPEFQLNEPVLTDLHVRLVAYGVPTDEWRRYQATAYGGVLEELRDVAERLAKRYQWNEAQATLFVLTGETPVLSPVKTTVHTSFPLSAASRITLTIDPSLTPRQVAQHYRNVQRRVLGHRHRAMSEKHLQLATFVAERPEDEPWAVRMQAWNQVYPEWSYNEVSNFNRDCAQASRRLLVPRYDAAALIGVEK